MRDSLGRETDHRTPCDEGKHEENCTDETCDCLCHVLWWMTPADQYLHGGREMNQGQPHDFEQDPGKTGSACRFCGLNERNPVHKTGAGPV